MFCRLGQFFFCLSWRVCYFKGRSLRCSLGWGNAGRCAVMLYVGEGPRGSNGACSTLHRTSVFHSATHNQIGPLWCWFPSGWACAHSRPLWVSPTTSPVRLGSLLPPPQPPQALSIRGLRLYFPTLEPRVMRSASLPSVRPGLSVRKCGAAGSASGRTACPVHPTLRQSHSCLGHASPLRPEPVSAPPTGLDVCFFFISLPFNFLSVLVVRGGAVCLPVPPSWFSWQLIHHVIFLI